MTQSNWPEVSKQIRSALDPEEFTTWISPLRLVEENQNRIVLAAPTSGFLNTLEESYRTVFDNAAGSVSGDNLEVVLTVPEVKSPVRRKAQPRLNSGYTFDTFVVGSSNQFAHAAARAVAESPFRSYNPLFLYGGVGLGKTHLLHAIGHHLRREQPELQVRYMPTEQFVNDLISSLRFNKMPDFRERHRNIDVLLIDDVQFLAGKERTQEEFFHTFNTLYSGQKQIILSSDSPPREIPTLEERLRSRFEWGLIADIQPPDLETKVAILRRKAEAEKVVLPTDVADFVARQVKSNVRELEGHLTRVLAFSSLTGKPLSLELAQETLKDILPPDHRVNPSEVIRFVARHYGLKVGEIKSKNNSKQIVFPRQVCMYLCKELTDLSFPEIGKLFSKHHTTVMHAVDKIEQLRSRDQDFNRTLQGLLQQFS